VQPENFLPLGRSSSLNWTACSPGRSNFIAIGGFALTFFYGLPRTTGDIDYFAAVPANLNPDEIAGQDSPLHKKYKVWLRRVSVANLPEEYAVRLRDMAPRQFKHLKLLVPDPYDCILSKIERASPKDRDDADYLFRSQKLDAHDLRQRYKNELRHNLIGNIEWHDQTLELWIEIFEAPR
jgi:hypothetical protein